MNTRLPLAILLTLFSLNLIQAQVIWTEPFFPTIADDVTVYFDASEGNGALAGFSGDIYAHTGVITSESTTPSDWKFVVSDWGVADTNVLMTNEGNDVYSLAFNIQDYYDFPMGTEVLEMAFVFRDVTGSTVARSSDGSDIYTPVYPENAGYLMSLLTPTEPIVTLNQIGDEINIQAVANADSEWRITIGGGTAHLASGISQLDYNLPATIFGANEVQVIASSNGDTLRQSFSYLIPADPTIQDAPAGTVDGINLISDTNVRLQLFAPGKENIYVLGDFNDYALSESFQMNRSTNGERFWLDITVTPDEWHTFQYLVDGSIFIADPYSELVLDPNNDSFVPTETWPDLPSYPDGANGIVTLFRSNPEPYDWQVTNFDRPANGDLVIYELLMRDFTDAKNYQTLLDSLDYLERLGINALQFMPINEFEGNQSWGYNPSYHMALDKAYGTPESFKAVIDACHARGIAVILDVVYNHAFSQSPLAQLYWDGGNPAPDNPWLNVEAKHPFNVGYDFNHESEATRSFVKRVMRYWLEEYRVDGFRFDLSKGFTQVDAMGNVGAWGQYDASRITILKEYADDMWATSPGSYVILEHFAANDEETELANYGCMLWGNMVHEYNEGSMGYDSRLDWGYYKNRGWNDPHLISYMESHDEERLMYKNLEFGASTGNYFVKHLPTALRRNELASCFFYTVPGAKMLWQFGEVGYDFSINYCTNGTVNPNCRLDPKPIRWDYYEDADRRRLYNVTAALINLKKDYDLFANPTDEDFMINDPNGTNGAPKRIRLSDGSLSAIIIGNFDIVQREVVPSFYSTGTWHEYFSGNTLDVTDTEAPILLEPGEYRIYFSEDLPEPPGGSIDYILSDEEATQVVSSFEVFPNPVIDQATIQFNLIDVAEVGWQMTDLNGRLIQQGQFGQRSIGNHQEQITMPELPEGMYFLSIFAGEHQYVTKLVVQ